MNRNTVEEIKARIPIEELISSYIKMEKSGRSYKARCPFHNEKTPSFFISPERGGYYCFGCGAKGDIFSFVEQFEGLDFKGALKVLAEKAGVPLVFDQKNEGEKDKFFRITEEVAKYFEEQFARSKEAESYVKGRGISPETIKAFRIGWAPEGWQNLLNYLKKKGWSELFIEQAGFIKKSDKTDSASDRSGLQSKSFSNNSIRYYDRFRGRIMFPITDSSGRVVAFTGRILKDDGKSAKYLNSPETPIFIKSQILFGLDKAKSEIRRLNYSILVEGQMDLILSHQVGVRNTIAASGTALTSEILNENGIVSNLGLVRRLSPNMIIALDSDKAGRVATMRAVATVALSMGMSVKIADSRSSGEETKDPADLIKSDPEKWKTVLKNSKHVIEFELANIISETTDSHKLGKALRERVFPFLARIDSEMDKAYFVKIIADKIRINEQAIWEDLRKFEKTIKPIEQVKDSLTKSDSQQKNKEKTLESSVNSKDEVNNQAVKSNRIDLVERRLFGLLFLMKKSKFKEAGMYEEKISKIAGEQFKQKEKMMETLSDDLIFEAESFYGSDSDNWEVHIKDLLVNFEEDLINAELIIAMNVLKNAEKEGDKEKVAEMAKKCQILSIRKAELLRNGKNKN